MCWVTRDRDIDWDIDRDRGSRIWWSDTAPRTAWDRCAVVWLSIRIWWSGTAPRTAWERGAEVWCSGRIWWSGAAPRTA